MSTDPNDADIMRGAGAISLFLQQLLGEPGINDKRVWQWIHRGTIPGGKVGGRVIASKKTIRRHYERATELSPN